MTETPGTQDGPTDQERLARAGLTRCVEPEDHLGAVVAEGLGVVRWWELIRGADPTAQEREAVEAALASVAGSGRPGDRLSSGLQRWRARADGADPAADLRNAERLGGGFLVPGDASWPERLHGLGPGEPLGLWWRGAGADSLAGRAVLAVVGTRDPTAYGVAATRQLVAPLVADGAVIVSGGALGIDAVAHQEALMGGTASPATVCVLAGGIDRLYPAANARLLSEIGREHLLLSEHPPGCAPTRWRFLARNRIIAALAAGTLVTEARWRSGSLSTAHRAAELGRWVGAVPGPMTVGTSEGCHRLVQEGAAELVTRPDDVKEALGWGKVAVLPGAATWGTAEQASSDEAKAGHASDASRPIDGLDELEARVWESLPVSRGVDLDRLLGVAGIGPSEALAALQRLATRGLVTTTQAGGWRRQRKGSA